MARRNLFLLVLVSLFSLLCYQRVQNNRYGRVLADAMDQVERRYLEPIGQDKLFEGAMEGMIRQLDDPYSEFIPSRELPEFNQTLEQEFGGLGMEVGLDPKTKQLTVLCPLVGTPAHQAGILAGDKILRIDGQSTQGLSLEDAVGRMRGELGSSVILSVLHEGDEQPVEIEIVRAIIRVDTVLGDTRAADGSWNFLLEADQRIGYLRINSFAKETSKELRQALQGLIDPRGLRLLHMAAFGAWDSQNLLPVVARIPCATIVTHQVFDQGMQGLILDLRNDPGGLLDAATEVCDMFIDSGVIVTTRGRDGKIDDTVEATGKGTFGGFPMAVLVNQLSASASEIVAACLQDHERAVVVGQRTWGKGTIQKVIDLKAGKGALKLTTSSYWRPSEKNIHRARDAGEEDEWGVRPDEGYEVVVEGEELTRLRLWRLRRDAYQPAGKGPAPGGDGAEPFVDPQLAKAVEYIEAQIAEGQ